MSPSNTDEIIARRMLRYCPCPSLRRRNRAEALDWAETAEANDLLLRDANALLFGAVFDYAVPISRAWQAPYELCRRLGHIDPARLAQMSVTRLLPYFRRGPHGNALHRFPKILAKRIILASRRLVRQYDADAANIWPDGSRAGDVLAALEDFCGIGQKISRMLVRLLGTYFGVSLMHWNEIDVAVDRHVARVFLRTGLVRRPPGTYSVADVKGEVIACARRLRPAFPGCLDEPAISIGIGWCTATECLCDGGEEDGPCPLSGCCRRNTDVSIRATGP